MATERSVEAVRTAADPRQTVQDLERYAGWLSRGTGPARVRDGVKAVGAAIANDRDVLAAVQELQTEVDKLGSGGVAGLLRRALQNLRAGLGEKALGEGHR